MLGMNLGRITEAVRGKLANVSRESKVSGVSIDSRRIRPRELFVDAQYFACRYAI